MGKTWKDKQKWEKKQEGKSIKKTKKEREYSSGSRFDDYNYKNTRISSYEWYEVEYED